MKTMICVVLDRSGSMSGREKDVIGGVNTFITEQQKLGLPASIALVRFDTGNIERFRPMSALKDIQPLVASDFVPRGGTPLLDAVGQTIMALEEDWKREQPDQAIMVIVTDGFENASTEFSKEKIRTLIQARQNSEKWAFIYLGANVDAFAEAGAMGIRSANTANYHSTVMGTSSAYSNLSADVSSKRMRGAFVAETFGGNVNEDGTVTKTVNVAPPATVTEPLPVSPVPAWTPPQGSPVWTPPAP